MPTVPVPLFQDYGYLLQSLRLSGIGMDSDAQIIVDNAIREAKVYFWKTLGKAQVDSIVAYSASANPSTDQQYIREVALLTEYKLVRVNLLKTMTTSLKDGSAQFWQEWNQEAAFRNSSEFSRQREINGLLEEIEANLSILSGQVSSGEEKRVKVFDNTRDDITVPVVIGSSVLGSGGIFGGLN